MKIMWGISGAGHLLKESIDVLAKLSEKHELTIIFSNAGLEVVKKYGYYRKIEKIISKNDANRIVFDSDEKYSYPLSGKLTYDKYDLIVISPTTANSVAKIVNGIADIIISFFLISSNDFAILIFSFSNFCFSILSNPKTVTLLFSLFNFLDK